MNLNNGNIFINKKGRGGDCQISIAKNSAFSTFWPSGPLLNAELGCDHEIHGNPNRFFGKTHLYHHKKAFDCGQSLVASTQ